jgi:hypothetical protein
LNEFLLACVAVGINSVAWLCMLLVQNWEASKGVFPARGKAPGQVLYLQDFWTNGLFGDLLALSLLDIALVIGAQRAGGFAEWQGWLCILVVVCVIVRVYYGNATKTDRRKEDWGYVYKGNRWRPTIGGKVYLAYFFLQLFGFFLGCWLLVTGDLKGIPLAFWVVGVALYAWVLIVDAKRGVLTP